MSVLKFVLNTLKKEGVGIDEKFRELREHYKEYQSFKKYLKEDLLYLGTENQNKDFEEFMKKIPQSDFKLFDKLLRKDLKKFHSVKLKERLDFSKSEDFNQIGYGTFFSNRPIEALWTTGHATFFLPTRKNRNNSFKVELFSIPPLNVRVGFEGDEVLKVKIPTMSSKNLKFTIDKSKIDNEISEIYIDTDKLWFPNLILNKKEAILVGVGVKSIVNESY